MHNQKPYSQNETTHISSTKKSVLGINEDGLCEACQYADIKKNIDWDDREKKLHKMLDKYRKNNGEYDCIVSGSGGKDSIFQSYILKF